MTDAPLARRRFAARSAIAAAIAALIVFSAVPFEPAGRVETASAADVAPAAKPGAKKGGRRGQAMRAKAQQNREQRKAAQQAEATAAIPKRPIKVAKVDPATLETVKASAAEIDRLVKANYEKFGVEPNPMTTDEQFVRRIYLDVTGTIPTHQQVNSFLKSDRPGKRSQLIDTLLNSWGYASHHYNYWGDVLRLSGELQRRLPAVAFNEWVKVSLETNMPYDQMVYAMLTAEGKVWDDPATGYALRDAGMPLDHLNNTVRIFLGTQIGCAQCHDHPFDRWTQKEFYELAAFNAGTRMRMRPKEFGGPKRLNQLRDEFAEMKGDQRAGQRAVAFLRSNVWAIHEDRGGKLRYPHDYAYDNASPGDVAMPRTIFGDPADPGASSPREAFAKWLTSPSNPRFAKTIANRLWAKSFGVGLIEPIDDIKDDSVVENEALLEFLTKEMVRVGFDMKEYLRILYNTETYQRQATLAEVTPGEEYHFPGPILRRMSAEQVWDSFITLAVFEPEEYQAAPASAYEQVLNVDLATIKPPQVEASLEHQRELNRLQQERNGAHRYKGQLLVRASELPAPAPPGHFLRQFGQSDREVISGSSTEGSVPQVLQMFNGPITHMLLEPKSLMYSNVTSQKNLKDQIDVIFKSILAREPSAEERSVARKQIDRHGMAGYGNVIWALVNTREFLFIQ